MGTPRKIQKKSGYPTTDGKMLDTYKEAMNHQTDIDLTKECEGFGSVIEPVALKEFIKCSPDVIQEYIKHHIAKKPAAKKTDKTQAAPKNTADKEAAN